MRAVAVLVGGPVHLVACEVLTEYDVAAGQVRDVGDSAVDYRHADAGPIQAHCRGCRGVDRLAMVVEGPGR